MGNTQIRKQRDVPQHQAEILAILHHSHSNDQRDALEYFQLLLELSGSYFRSRGDSPLHIAAAGNNVAFLNLLLDSGHAAESSTSRTRRTILHTAAQWNAYQVASRLADQGQMLEAVDSNNLSPLHIAAEVNCVDVAQVLIAQGANVERTVLAYGVGQHATLKNATALHVASHNGNQEMVALLLHSGAKVNAMTHQGQTPLHLACEAGNVEIATSLLDAGADVEAGSGWWVVGSALSLAAMRNQLSIAQLLLKAGANPNACNQSNHTALLYAARNGSEDMACLLLQHGAKVETVPRFGRVTQSQAIHWACGASLGVTKSLADHGANLEDVDHLGDTPLHWACRANQTAVASFLVSHNVHVDVKNLRSETPLAVSLLAGHAGIARSLINAGADIRKVQNDSIMLACSNNLGVAGLVDELRVQQ